MVHKTDQQIDKLICRLKNEINSEKSIASLCHVGVLGMHWGHRKSTSNESLSEDHKKARVLKKKKIGEMSNTELKELTTRLQLEKQYKELSKSGGFAGKKFIQDLFSNAVKQTASTYVSKYLSKGVDQLLKNTSK